MVRRATQPGRMRLYCFAYAGGSAAVYAGWQNLLGPDIEVCAIQLPGRGGRIAEAPRRALQPLVDELALAVANQPARPFALFGHSLGALMAFEVAQALRLRRLPLPSHLFVSGCRAPSLGREAKGLHLLPNREFIEALRGYNGTPAEVLGNAELMALVMPMLRADFALVDDFRYQRRPALPVALTVLAGRDDQAATLDGIENWALEADDFRGVQWFDGGHFFLHNAGAAIAIADSIARALAVQRAA
ncbi:thioesterase [Rugamonas sp. CCM 8940]|nr:thioesterase [Rugamonas sp. CCM 8940]